MYSESGRPTEFYSEIGGNNSIFKHFGMFSQYLTPRRHSTISLLNNIVYLVFLLSTTVQGAKDYLRDAGHLRGVYSASLHAGLFQYHTSDVALGHSTSHLLVLLLFKAKLVVNTFEEYPVQEGRRPVIQTPRYGLSGATGVNCFGVRQDSPEEVILSSILKWR